ncbi:hypothetical protein CNEO4_260001 [Clostridium neonatale]|nr:hypothetical protein CNEO4_1550001 [Clostridium neonatale]CAI3624231.1 hypothetical protein CNEO4_260001 [Clostridium neonatale]CAI4139516.1 hypothetical protein CNEO4_2170001 [Clostridium neonatale]
MIYIYKLLKLTTLNGRLLFPVPAWFQDGRQSPLRLPHRTYQAGQYQHKEAGGKPGGSRPCEADVRDVRPAHNFLLGHYPVLCRTGDFVQWQGTDTPYIGADVTQPGLCAGRP